MNIFQQGQGWLEPLQAALGTRPDMGTLRLGQLDMLIHLSAHLWDVGRNWSTWKKPMQTEEEHANSTQSASISHA